MRNELTNWSILNLIGEEVFASQVVCSALLRPFKELFSNSNMPSYYIQEELNMKGYPYAYNLSEKRVVNSIENGLLDSAKLFEVYYGIQSQLYPQLLLVIKLKNYMNNSLIFLIQHLVD